MTAPSSNWKCPDCGAEVDAGFEVCWACGTAHDGTADPDFEVATAPIIDTDRVDAPSPWLAALMVLFFPALIVYGIMKLLFPLRAGHRQFTIRSLLLVIALVAIVLGCWKWLGSLLLRP
jgi:hypothetical protein